MLLQFSEWTPYLTDLGEVSVKHGVKVHIYSLATGDAGSRELPAKLKAAPPAQSATQVPGERLPAAAVSPEARKTAGTYRWIYFALVVAALTVAGFLWIRQHAYCTPSAETERWYEDGVAALREGTYLKPANALKQSLANDSRSVMTHARLADAYNELDYYSEAKDEF
jgi:hypothetical protein